MTETSANDSYFKDDSPSDHSGSLPGEIESVSEDAPCTQMPGSSYLLCPRKHPLEAAKGQPSPKKNVQQAYTVVRVKVVMLLCLWESQGEVLVVVEKAKEKVETIVTEKILLEKVMILIQIKDGEGRDGSKRCARTERKNSSKGDSKRK